MTTHDKVLSNMITNLLFRENRLDSKVEFIVMNTLRDWNIYMDSNMKDNFVMDMEEALEERFIGLGEPEKLAIPFLKNPNERNRTTILNFIYRDELDNDSKSLRYAYRCVIQNKPIEKERILFYLKQDVSWFEMVLENKNYTEAEYLEVISKLKSSLKFTLSLIDDLELAKHDKMQMLYLKSIIGDN